MEQYRSSLTPRTQRRSQNKCSDFAKIGSIFVISKFLSSEIKKSLFFYDE